MNFLKRQSGSCLTCLVVNGE